LNLSNLNSSVRRTGLKSIRPFGERIRTLMGILSLELRKLGLTEKETDVYLAVLELGPLPASNISDIVKISRPTVYEILKSLQKKGLVTETKPKRKKEFAAESPDKLLRIIKIQKREIEEKERELIRIIAALRAKYYLKTKKEIKTYSKKQGRKILLEDLLVTPSKKIYVLSVSFNSKQQRKLEEIYKKIKKRLGEIEVKEIFPAYITSRTTAGRPKIRKSKFNFVQRKFFPNLVNYFSGTLIISDKIFFFDNKNDFCIEQENIVNLFKSLFEIIWGRAVK